MGGKDQEWEPNFPKLPLLHIPPPSSAVESPENPSGTSTPPLQTSVSVPFKWEEHPGKPKPCTDLIPLPIKILELPPCRTASLYNMDNNSSPASGITKTPSPTTVLDGPYNVARPKFSSFRLFRESSHNEYYFEDGVRSPFDEDDTLFVGGKTKRVKGIFGKLRGGKRVFDGGSSRFSPSSNISNCENGERCSRVKSGDNGGGKMRRNGSFTNVSHAKPSHIWGSIYEGLKQVMHWKSGKKSSKEGRD